eukprot:TRINITY_DN32702_c0_g1_i1.p1 TRINITY_DN32702_c0_g1~~TRINITY_DN32702_c0_g1_i1.p1  ORF type:complete len:484 (-),score=80.04 TRINITY_DN32702_c0_g1_i1:2-1453(-)
MASQPLAPKSQLPWAVWKLMVSYVVMSIVFHCAKELYGPFLRSLVVCDGVASKPLSVEAGTAAEDAAPFSGSSRCSDTQHVLAVAQAQEGRLVGMKIFVHGCAGPFLAVFADRYGRRPVLIVALSGFACAFAMFATVAAHPNLHESTSIMTWCFFIEGITGAFDVTYLAMLADMTPDSTMRTHAFRIYFAIGALALAAAQLVSVAILESALESYTVVWLVLSAVLIGDVIFVFKVVSESLCATARCEDLPPVESLEAAIRLIQSSARGCVQFLAHSRFLHAWMLAVFLAALTEGQRLIEPTFTIAMYGWRPGDLQAYTCPAKLLQLASLTLLAPLTSQYSTVGVCTFVTFAGCVASSLAVFAPFSSSALVLPSLLCSGLAFGRPVMEAFLSSHFAAEQQAKVQAVSHLCSNLGTSISMAAFSSPLLFQPEATGWAASRPFVLSAAFACASAVVRLAIFRGDLPARFLTAKGAAFWRTGESYDV